ncbi:hypothetical protein POX_b02379 [Penicillium oxalicum]|uniref:hypothetical protein n=1 Tax=Penicillium oxalicum TaxID=69781 RepID=UPI0020B8157F|nr:hypothetical protein POX_b02379 [Penicillium oxalicum]KAI2792342.1 hypothetical protein POX_b02379 [Penicillium oxalicum]
MCPSYGLSVAYDPVIFIARNPYRQRNSNLERSESDQTIWASLEYTKSCYEQAYGRITGVCEFHIISGPSSLHLFEDSDTAQFFSDHTSQLENTNRRMMVVLNGWNSLTSDIGTFNMFFREHAPQITLRIFADQPRSFYQVNVAQFFQLLDCITQLNEMGGGATEEESRGDVTELLRCIEARLEYSTGLFYHYFVAGGGDSFNQI